MGYSQRDMREAVALLRDRCPTLLPVRVYRRQINCGAVGLCKLVVDEKGQPVRFIITVDSRLPWNTAWHILIHEWAHAVSWQDGETVDDHGPEWGLAVARCYTECE